MLFSTPGRWRHQNTFDLQFPHIIMPVPIADVQLQLRLHPTRKRERGYGSLRRALDVASNDYKREDDAKGFDSSHYESQHTLLLIRKGILHRVSRNVHQCNIIICNLRNFREFYSSCHEIFHTIFSNVKIDQIIRYRFWVPRHPISRCYETI